MGEIVKEWSPQWGAAGVDLSDLDINEFYIDIQQPQLYIDYNMRKVVALNDGTDIMTDTNRQSSGMKRLQHSHKVDHSAVRGVTWATTSGCNFEHTDLVAARASESSITTFQGSEHKFVPLDHVRDLDEVKNINDVADRKTKSVASSMKKLRHDIGDLSQPDQPEREGEEKNDPESIPDDVEQFLVGGDKVDLEERGNDADIELCAVEEDLNVGTGPAATSTPTLDICGNAREWFAGQKRVHDQRGTDAEGTYTQLTVEEIKKSNNRYLLHSGPNQDNVHKLRQQERLERLHKLYEAGELKECTLSYYLYHTQDLRRNMRKRLYGVVNNERNPLGLRTRLAKLPAGYNVVSDRSFAHDAPKYPNLNAHITPHFLAGRKQFQKEETSSMRGVSTLRYTSEVIFSHIFNEQSLKDSVRFGLFSILNDCWDWGHAAANLNAPLRVPANWNEYLNRSK